MEEKFKKLYDKDDKLAYQILLELEKETEESNKLYKYFDELLSMLKSEKTFVRVRGFRLICHLAKWDKENKIENNLTKILKELDDETGTSVRQCIGKLDLIIKYKPELSKRIETKLKKLDLSKYKESVQSLIERDIEKLLK